jgi:hypothetical protein
VYFWSTSLCNQHQKVLFCWQVEELYSLDQDSLQALK